MKILAGPSVVKVTTARAGGHQVEPLARHPRTLLAAASCRVQPPLPLHHGGLLHIPQPPLIVRQVERLARHPRLHRRLRHPGGHRQQQPGVEGLGDEVFPAEFEVLLLIIKGVEAGARCRPYHPPPPALGAARPRPRLVARLVPLSITVVRVPREIPVGPRARERARFADHGVLGEGGDSLGGRALHLLVDARGAAVERPPEEMREGADVVDLVGMVASPGGHNHVRPRGLGEVRVDLWRRVGAREHERVAVHCQEHLGLEEPPRA
mmetsp:Transcript_54896/g.174465  ORF Transcript_54896/g.174465 Transcript_54896/m.174465 type:complete len:266 (+) Transcript_54896:34-831(+)